MNSVSVEELELLSFFEAEPVLADKNIPWPYNDFSYEVEIGEYKVSFGIAPSYPDLSLSIFHNGAIIYSFTALSVKDVRYHKDGDLETLEIVVSDQDSIWFQLRPNLLVTQRAGET
ncbi:MAG TPA: hypothetical protein VN017_06825 [Pseudoxanthomonas sp.]|nr:hypothetical protein [Pseudoxanthomonas sp.]